MKNLFSVPMVRMFGIAALVAVIGFSMVACDDDPGGDPNPGGGTLAFELITEEDAVLQRETVDTYRVSKGTVTSGAVVIPATHNDKAVTSIASEGFRYPRSENITSVTIPNSVTYIGDLAFANCQSLTSVTFQGTIADFGYNAFGDSDLIEKYIAGGPGTYTSTNGTEFLSVWTKQ